MYTTRILKNIFSGVLITGIAISAFSCKPGGKKGATNVSDNAAEQTYVAPGKYDEFYSFMSGGFSGQLTVYGLPSGRLFRVIPVFSQHPESGYGYAEETKPMLMTTRGFIPWDDLHHPELSMKDGTPDGRWIFVNGNNSPRIARIDLTTMRTAEILEIPNSSGNHSSPFTTENSEYVIASTRFSFPTGDVKDVSLNSYKENFKGNISYVRVDPNSGKMNVAFQIKTPPFNWDLSHCGKGPSHDWTFLTCYNSEEANTMLEANASQRDKDFILAINWKMAEDYVKQGKGQQIPGKHYHNVYDESKHSATSEIIETVTQIDPKDIPGMMYLIPCPKSPHGVDVDPSGEYFAGAGKLASLIPVYSFKKMQDAIKNKKFDGEMEGIPVIKYEDALAGEVKKPGLGPLHTEYDNKGYGYTTMFISSEIVKWKIGTWEVVDRMPVYYSPGHLMIPGGDSKKPWGKYLVSMNKITKDRYLPTGPELTQSAQLIDISGDKMKMILDFPTNGEPHYAQALPADMIKDKQVKIFKLDNNKHPYATKAEKDARVVREGNKVHVYMTCIRSHFVPDNIEGIQLGDEVYFHVTNLEQDWDVPHGFAIKYAQNAELLILPGETQTLKWIPEQVGVQAFYCTDFCSALHQEMQGYARVSPKGSNVPIKFYTGNQQ